MKKKCFNISIYTVFYNKTKFNTINIKFEFRILEAQACQVSHISHDSHAFILKHAFMHT